MSEITHANQVRGAEFKRLMKKPLVWILILGLTVAAGAIFGIMAAPAAGAAAAAIVLVLGVGIAFGVADHNAEQAFYAAYAESRGLTRSETQLGALTPLLGKGDSRKTDVMFTGNLEPGLEGSLALFTYTIESRDSDGDRTETDYPFTLVLFNLPDTAAHLPELLVQNQSGFKSWEGLEDKFRGDHERVTLESEAMRDRYEIFVQKQQDPVWVRRLFSPSFIVWLTDSPPKKFAFELVAGTLVTYVPKHRDSAEGLDEMITLGSAVAKRLAEEAAETSS
ncbi:MAG: hypothetical protein JJE13_08845 [Thermoleophilia bacterium]|nr:hypothetical protein [Thermoleophilia bacterium]